jgi:hypothetical protein
MWRRATAEPGPSPAANGGGGASGAPGGGAGSAQQSQDLAEILSAITSLRSEVATLTDLLHTAVPSLPASPDFSPERRAGLTRH